MSFQNNNLTPDLTRRELDVLSLMTQAYSNQAISTELNVSIETTRTHAKRIYSKLGVSGRQEASLKAIELGLVESDSAPTPTVKTHLPLSLEPFIGRKSDLAELSTLFASGDRLITILGVGGMGKTRLAIEYAQQHIADYKDGVFFIPLETITSVDNILFQIIDRLPLSLSTKTTPQEQLLNFLSDKQLLLVIDNWEHLLDGALLVSNILQSAPQVQIIATSREKLKLRNEAIYHLNGLALPSAEDILDYDAVQLILQTAKRIHSDWEINEDNLQAIYTLCRITQGMPLGIILAVGWIDAYPLERIVEEIQKSIDFLQTDLRDIPNRHRSIRAVFEWTWGLLTQAERDVFMKFSLFRNGCTLAAAEIITEATPHILQSLVNKALLHRDPSGRYVLHELIRQYGEEQLRQQKDVNQNTRDAHARYYADVADQIMTNELPAQRGETEAENLYIAWYWAVDSLNTDMIWRYINTFGIISYQFGIFREMQIIYDYAINQLTKHEADYPLLLGSLLYVNASIHSYLRHTEAVQSHIERGQSLFKDTDWTMQRRELIYVHYHLGLAFRRSDYHISLQVIEQIESLLESLDLSGDRVGLTMLAYTQSQHSILYDYMNDRDNTLYYALKALHVAREIQQHSIIALSTFMLGAAEYTAQNYELASTYFRESEITYRQELATSTDFLFLLSFAGACAVEQGHFDEARRYLQECLLLSHEFGFGDPIFITMCAVAEWKLIEGHLEDALEIVGYCKQYTSYLGSNNRIAFLLPLLKAQLSPKAFQESIERGQAMTYDDAILEITVWLED